MSFPKPGIIRLKGKALEALRERVYAEQEGFCYECLSWFPLHGHVMFRMHLAHLRNKRMYGDTRENVCCKCPHCHLVKEHNPKSVPRKDRP